MRSNRKGSPDRLRLVVIAGIVGVTAYAVSADQAQQLLQARPAASCDIKGNISQRTGERIYHVPGQRYYAATRIARLNGERWFCTESEARAAGWRRSRL